MKKKHSITTKTGDRGETSLYSGQRVHKNDPLVAAIGAVDELGSVLGIARLFCKKEKNRQAVFDIQRRLFTVNSELATPPDHLGRLSDRVDEDFVEDLDKRREALEEEVELPGKFVVAAENFASAHLELARCVARRCEREVVGLFRDAAIDNTHILVWFNRLSDYLFLLARDEE